MFGGLCAGLYHTFLVHNFKLNTYNVVSVLFSVGC